MDNYFFLKNLLLFIGLLTFIKAESELESNTESVNETVPQDLYVIKTVVYEVGILTEAGNDTDNNETHEQVDFTIFDPSRNGSSIDLSNIPVPLQTNVSGVSVAGLLPGADLTSILLPKKQVTVTQNISTSSPEKGSTIISNLPKILGLTPPKKSEVKEDSENRKEANK